MSLSSLRKARLMMCQVTEMSRTCSTSRIHREVIQAKGHAGSNQKSALVVWTCVMPVTTARGAAEFRHTTASRLSGG